MTIIQANLKFKNALVPLDFNRVEFLFIHHLKAVTATPQEIHKWHLDNGWSGFGYGEYIKKDGTVYIGRGDNVGVHTANYNSVSYGIACEGDYDIEKNMPDAQFNTLVARVKYHINRFPKKLRVLGHGEVNKTDCPGKNFPMIKLYQEIERKVEVVEEDNEFTETLQYLEKYNEPTEYKALAYRFKEILSNAFDTNKFTREQLRDIFRKRG
jgi:N-acetylmuramoyl-L-alanine amidase